MSKELSRRSFLKGLAAASAGAASVGLLGVAPVLASSESAEGALYIPGIYTASATGMGTVKMTAAFDANSIIDIQMEVAEETVEIGQAAKDELIRQLLDAQSTEIDGVTGASVTTDAAKECLAKCIAQAKGEASAEPMPLPSNSPEGYVCAEDWLGEAPKVAESLIVETKTADVVVVGGGHSGTQAFLGAAQQGASVFMLEAMEEAKYSCYGDDIGTVNSELLTKRGFGGYDVGEITAEFVRRGGSRVDPEIIRLFVENSGEMLDNMAACVPETSNVFDFDDYQCQVQIAYDCPDASYYPIERGGWKAWATTVQTIGRVNPTPVHGKENVSRLTELEYYCQDAAVALGGKIEWGTRGVVLEQNDEGDVTGVIALGPDGYVRYRANKGVILAAGDFAANADMCYNLLTDCNEVTIRSGGDRNSIKGPGRDGSGIKMGCWAGGMVETGPRPSMNTMGGIPGPWGSTPFLYLNAKGKRYCNEAMITAVTPATIKQPKGIIATICDADWLEGVKNAGIDHGAPNWGAAGIEDLKVMDKLAEGMSHAVEAGPEGCDVQGTVIINASMSMADHIYGAETLDELLSYIGYEGEAKEQALRTIEEYNAMCDAGVDTQYGKDPIVMKAIRKAPFYAAVKQNTGMSSAGLVTLAGLITDEHLNVLREDRTTPIKGLYAVGNCLGQRFGVGYCTPFAGCSMGMAMTHGRVAGKYVANL